MEIVPELTKCMMGRNVVNCQRLIKSEWADTRPDEGAHMSADSQGLSDIRTEGAHVGSLRAHNPKSDIAFVNRHYLENMEHNSSWFARDRFPGTRCFVQGNSVDLHSGIHWWDLF
jgi:hypothetical protein